MDDRTTKSMELHAREHAASIEADVARLVKLRGLNARGLAADAVVEELEEEIGGWNYGAGMTITIDVTMYGGGPAGGIEFECEVGGHGLKMLRADVWHNDWFQERGRARLVDDTAETLWSLWYLESLWDR